MPAKLPPKYLRSTVPKKAGKKRKVTLKEVRLVFNKGLSSERVRLYNVFLRDKLYGGVTVKCGETPRERHWTITSFAPYAYVCDGNPTPEERQPGFGKAVLSTLEKDFLSTVEPGDKRRMKLRISHYRPSIERTALTAGFKETGERVFSEGSGLIEKFFVKRLR
jgi:hypothetical protein